MDDALVDDLPQDQWVEDSDRCVDDHEDHEDGEDRAVRRGEIGYTSERSWCDLDSRHRVVTPERAHVDAVHSPTARTHLFASLRFLPASTVRRRPVRLRAGRIEVRSPTCKKETWFPISSFPTRPARSAS